MLMWAAYTVKRMFDVLRYLFETYYTPHACPTTDALVRKLSAVGFERDEIDEAMDWLSNLSRATHGPLPEGFSEDGTARVYSAREYEYLGRDGIGFIAFLDNEQVLDPVLRELIIDLAMGLNKTPVSLDKLKVIVLMVMWSQEAEVDVLILEELLDGGGPRKLH